MRIQLFCMKPMTFPLLSISLKSFYQKMFIKEGLRFGVRTCISKANKGDRAVVEIPDVNFQDS